MLPREELLRNMLELPGEIPADLHAKSTNSCDRIRVQAGRHLVAIELVQRGQDAIADDRALQR